MKRSFLVGLIRKTLFILLMFLLCLSYTPSDGHSGRTDKKGGHTDSKTGKYHYHNDGNNDGNPDWKLGC